MRPLRPDQARPFLTLGIVVLAWLLVPAAAKRFFRTTLFEAQAPIAAAASRVRDLQEFWALRTQSSNELIAAGLETSATLASYELGVSRVEQLEAENGRLRDLLSIPREAGWRYERARVVLRDFSAWWQQLVIRKGADDGIPVGAPVVYSGGVVGRVREVRANTSVVELISSPGLRLAGVIEGGVRSGDQRPVSYQGGDNPAFGPAHGVAEYVALDVFATPKAPLRLVTSGLGGVFPPGLFIGHITKVELGTDGLFKTAEVELDQALSSLTEVTVLVPVPTPAP